MTDDQISALLPGTHYMDPPDGGSVALIEQLQRMAHDAARYRWLKRNPQWLGWEHDFRPDEVERAIDAAMAAVPVLGAA